MSVATSSRLAARLFGRTRVLVGAESKLAPETCQRINKSIFFIPDADFAAENSYFYVAPAAGRGGTNNKEARAAKRANAWRDLKSGEEQMADPGSRAGCSRRGKARGNLRSHTVSDTRSCRIRDTTFFAKGLRGTLLAGLVTAMTS